ncbi:hypothetical protein KKD49_14810 [Myxococcota bacterium]|nr:hypothetical protein [Myxococcota bacterium]
MIFIGVTLCTVCVWGISFSFRRMVYKNIPVKTRLAAAISSWIFLAGFFGSLAILFTDGLL